jgi:hypothetical protein
MWGVTNPSQVRYVNSYFSHLLITTKRLVAGRWAFISVNADEFLRSLF